MYRRQVPKPFDPLSLEVALTLVELGAGDIALPVALGNVARGLSQLQSREALAGQFLFCFHPLFFLHLPQDGSAQPVKEEGLEYICACQERNQSCLHILDR